MKRKKLHGYDIAIKKYTGTLPESAEGQDAGTAIKNPDSYEYSSNVQATADGDGKYFALPTDASYVTGTVDTGVVVNIKGSEFVWVPVEDVVLDTNKTGDLPTSSASGKTYTPMAVKVEDNYKGLLYNFSGDNGYIMYNDSSNNYLGITSQYREPEVLSYDIEDYRDEGITLEKLTTEYNEMIESVLKYKGFYVARYEAGLDKNNNIVFKDASKNESELTTADASNSQTYIWYGLYKKIKTFATNSDGFVSNMIWGSQYDAMMNWMAKNGEKVGNADESKKNTETVTGKCKDDVINNIYDLYGCHREWTQEVIDNNVRVSRGGFYNDNISPVIRNGDYPYGTSKGYSSRATLYIK